MVDHEAVYRVLFNGVLDAIGEIEKQNYGSAKLTLVKMLQTAEETCFDSMEEPPVQGLVPPPVPESAGARPRMD
ncbi:hypothetical protein SAMN02745823_03069 [Sporobacter termitidis DSM 10068]|uniref:Uncharacterized protein n=1 Tax=Sporobacter termitidis DSM 10068 TaxID=1123282 RepID=A0A1M5Z1B9_9FIRM|nr:hypothetical protein [Sporobacter termitidis]SHI17934.1 hypothetical protein SAMN02745823_03069 [Sporobacter termitidis DSM 10068]